MDEQTEKLVKSVTLIDPAEVSPAMWREFISSHCWGAVVRDILDRDAIITNYLRYGDPSRIWTDSEMRSRINELQFVLSLPVMALADAEAINQEKEKNDGRAESR